MADTQEALTTLSYINVPPAQTWNYLKIDETSLTVPAAKATGDVYARLPVSSMPLSAASAKRPSPGSRTLPRTRPISRCRHTISAKSPSPAS